MLQLLFMFLCTELKPHSYCSSVSRAGELPYGASCSRLRARFDLSFTTGLVHPDIQNHPTVAEARQQFPMSCSYKNTGNGDDKDHTKIHAITHNKGMGEQSYVPRL